MRSFPKRPDRPPKGHGVTPRSLDAMRHTSREAEASPPTHLVHLPASASLSF